MSDPNSNSLLNAATNAAQSATPASPYVIVPPTQVGQQPQWIHATTASPVPQLPEVQSASVFADPVAEVVPAPAAPVVHHPFVPVPAAPVAPAVSIPQMQAVPVVQAAPVVSAPPHGTYIEEYTEQVTWTVPDSIQPNEGWPTVPFRNGTPWTVQLFKAQCLSCTGINPFPSATLVYEEQKCSRADSCPAGSIQFSAVGLIRVLTKTLLEAKASRDPVTLATAMQTVATRPGLSDEDRQAIFRECGFL